MARDTQYTLYKTGRTDPTLKHIWGFDSVEQRDTWLNSKSPLPVLNVKYWRVGNTIKIPVSYEDSFEYDYVRIVNHSSDATKRREYFCFVTGHAYLSNNATMLTLAVDYVQTWYWSSQVDGICPFWNVEGFISTATNKTLPPRGTKGEFPVPESVVMDTQYAFKDYAVVIYSSINISDLDNPHYTYAIIDGQYTACPPYIMSANINAITNIIEKVNTLGYTDAIAGIYLVPTAYLNVESIPTTPTIPAGSDWQSEMQITVEKPTTCDGYTPNNKQLLGYDYSYFTINNGQGEIASYNFEDFNGTPTFNIRMSFGSGSPVLIMYPHNYITKSGDAYREMAIKVTQAPACSYLNDSYKIWLAQTQNSRAAAKAGAHLTLRQAKEAQAASVQALAGQAYTAIDNVFGLSETTEKATAGAIENTKSGLGLALEQAGKRLSETGIWWLGGKDSSASKKVSAALENTGSSVRSFDTSGLTSWLNQMGEAFIKNQLGIEHAYIYDHAVQSAQQNINALLAGYADKARVPATATGSNAYGDMCALAQYGFMISVHTPTAHYAEWIDNNLSASGHTVNKYGIVTRWHAIFDCFSVYSPYIPVNVKDRPEYVRKMFIDLMQNGIYVWHYYGGDISDRIGVPYKLNNPEV